MRRALVGYERSNADSSRMFETLQWMMDNRRDLVDGGVEDTIFNLRKRTLRRKHEGDFLADTRAFDLVILHHIFAGFNGTVPRDDKFAQRWEFATSPQHGPQQWRDRLTATGATLIFAFGNGTEVAAEYLGKLDGYRAHHGDGFVVYERLTPS